ncbi:hypothetical protein D4764_19G0000250 [Takifugu flavidus]|uniref:Reverse transcriptase zinc-binding domain-containing protein n=1 Tax=Takifugu flavidus TaxID=433684 RepID=A0A5C6NRD0_9TELE|nr:hypothetical protein D4764_19G0000250 [Takifugu flavidus]
MDDLTVMTTSVPCCRWLLQGLERLISWARMGFKPAKSRSLVLRKGKVADRFRFGLRRDTNSNGDRKTCQEPGQGLQQLLEGLRCTPASQGRFDIMAHSNRELGASREIQNLDLPTWGPAKTPLAPACLRAVGRAGLSSFSIPRYDKARGREKRSMVQDEIRAELEEDRRVKMVAMYQQSAWTRWEHAEQRKLTWPELWRLEPQHIRFLIQSVYNVLPSPTNLQRWGLAATAACQLCKKRATLEHILGCCPKALGDGRYRWRHDQVLRTLADTVSAAINNYMVLTSESTKQVALVELTVPWEDRLEEANERKRAKYANLVIECQNNGWKARCEPVERLGRKLQDGYGFGGGIRGVVGHLDASRGLITPGWVARARVFDDQ